LRAVLGRDLLHATRAARLTAAALLVVLAVALGVLVTPGARAADARVIAAGVSVDGVDVSGLTVDAASAKLLGALVPVLNRPVIVGVGGKVFHFAPGQAKLSVDGPTSAQRAYAAGQAANGGPVSVPLVVHHDQTVVTKWVGTVARHVDAPAGNATVTITLTHLYVHRSHTGHAVVQAPLARAIGSAIESPSAVRTLHVKLAITHPAINANKAIARYSTVVTVDRAHFRLRLFKLLHEVASYPIAVGMAGLETPAGIYHVQEREVNPSWHVPNSPWAGALAGQTIPPGPNDPIVARWLGLGGGVGIHGTNEPFSIGSRASHGCIRMLVPDVIKLYPRVPLGTTVYIR
jgi:lipoprotein-anchoring transpeptidase ErfK/SrfK